MFIAIGIIVALLCLIGFMVFPASMRNEEESAVKGYEFSRIDDVQGILTVDGKEISTYASGNLSFDGIVRVDLYQSCGSKIKIIDVCYRGESLFPYAPQGSSYKARTDYALQAIKQVASQGLISRDLAINVERTILKIEDLNEYLDKGTVYVKNDEYVWAM